MSWEVGGREHEATPPISAQDVLDATRTFPPSTGLGWDAFHPRLLLQLPLCLIEAFAEILNRWEQDPRTGQMWLILVVFLDKATGGVRPIGLLPLWARVWSRIRHKLCAIWERSLDADFSGAAIPAQRATRAPGSTTP